MAVKLWSNRIEQFVDGTGVPRSGAKLFTYAGGSVNTKQTTYIESTGSTPNTNPIVLDSSGRIPQPIWLTTGLSYKFVLAPPTDTDPPTSPIDTLDVITGINDSSASPSEWVSGPTPTFISVTSFSLVGDQTSTFSQGRRLKFTETAGTVYGTIINSTFGAATTVVVKVDSGTLDSGLSAISYGIISASHPSDPASTVNAQPVCNGRLTLTTGTAITTADVTAATSVFFTPFGGNTVDLYDGSANWVRYTFAELTLAVPASTSQMYDVFLQNNAGTLQLNAVAWTNDTTRATALVLQNGVNVKSGATSQRYLGSFRTTTVAGQTEDSVAKRYVWNYYNRVLRSMRVVEATATWAYTLNTLRQANAAAANQLDMVIGLSEAPVIARVHASVSNSTGGTFFAVGVGLDSTLVNSAQKWGPTAAGAANVNTFGWAEYVGYPGIGRHILTWLEKSQAVGTSTWVGTDGSGAAVNGISGEVLG